MMNINFNIPKKSNFSLTETCSIVDIKAYVLRFWESEFSELNPTISSSGQKLFRYEDLEILFYIKELLFNNKLTIDQAKPELNQLLKDKLISNSVIEDDNVSLNTINEASVNEGHQILSTTTIPTTLSSEKNVIENSNFDELKSMLTGLSSRLTEIQSANNWI